MFKRSGFSPVMPSDDFRAQLNLLADAYAELHDRILANATNTDDNAAFKPCLSLADELATNTKTDVTHYDNIPMNATITDGNAAFKSCLSLADELVTNTKTRVTIRRRGTGTAINRACGSVSDTSHKIRDVFSTVVVVKEPTKLSRKTGTTHVVHSYSDELRTSAFISSGFALSALAKFETVIEYMLLVFLLVDFAHVPLMVAWNTTDTPISTAYLACAIVFWTIDVVFRIQVRGRSVLRARARLSFDLALILVDVLLFVSSFFRLRNTELDLVFRCVRLLRLARLVRGLAVVAYSKSIGMLTAGESRWPFSAVFVRMLLAVLSLNHLLCCLWYAVGAESGGHTGISWLDFPQYYEALGSLEGSGQFFQYLTSMQFVLSLMTPSTSDILPQNSNEKVTAIVFTITGLFTVALVTSQLSAKLVRMQNCKREQLDLEDRLSQFFLKHQVPRSLAEEVHCSITEKLSAAAALSTGLLPEMQLLTTSLRRCLLVVLHSKELLRHTFFASCMSPARALDDISEKVRQDIWRPGDELFRQFKDADRFYFVKSGVLRYSHFEFGFSTVTDHSWVSVIALWCEWVYQGFLETESACDILTLEIANVLEVIQHCPEIQVLSRYYGESYVRSANEYPGPLIELDLPHEEIMLLMPRKARRIFASRLLQANKKKPQCSEQLLEEIQQGKCVLSLDRDGGLIRSLHLYVLSMHRISDYALLYQIAASDAKTFAPDVLKPAWKRQAENTSAALAVKEFFMSRLPCLSGFPQIVESSEKSERTKSGKFDVQTVYTKTTLQIEFEETGNVHSSLLSESFGTWYTQSNPNTELSSVAVFPGLNTQDKVTLYAWLPEEDVQWLSDHTTDLNRWLNTLDHDECVNEAALHIGPITRTKYEEMVFLTSDNDSRVENEISM